MNFNILYNIFWILGTLPLFASRVFLPAFLMGIFLRFPQYFPFLDLRVSQENLISDIFLIILGLLSIAEIWADKNADIRNLLNSIESIAKPLAFLVLELQLTDELTMAVISQIHWAGFEISHIFAALGAFGVFALNRLRQNFYGFLYSLDDNDTLGLRRMFSYLEDSLVIFGFLLLIYLGVLAFIFYGIFWISLYLFQKKVEHNQEKHKKACPNCQQLVLPFAVACPNCHTHQNKILDINFLGVRKEKAISDIENHRRRLIRHKRCPECANRLQNQVYKQVCTACGITSNVLVSSNLYIKDLDKRFLITLLVSTALGFIPVVGIVAAAIFMNFYLISPLLRYIPKSKAFFAKILIRIFFIVVVLTGTVAGFLTAPLYCVVRYFSLRRFFVKANIT